MYGAMGSTITTDLVMRTKKSDYPGLWPGIVEFVHDPQQMGRVKVRVPNIHGDERVTKAEHLPWALRNEMGGGGFDYGSFTPLLPGASVWVMFLNDDVNQPVVIGTHSAMPKKRGLYGQSDPDMLPIAESDSSLGPWKGREVTIEDETETPGQSEQPCETRQIAFHEPTVWVPFKSWKGASIVIEERDGREKMEILDRSGQGLQMRSNIKPDLNKNNRMQRAGRSVFRGDQFSYKEHTENRESSVSLRDLAQQGIFTQARRDDERVKLVSKVPDSSDRGLIDFDMGETQIAVELAAGHRRAVIEGKNQGRVMFKLSFDAQRGIINIEADNSIRLNAPRFYVSAADITFKGDLLLDGDLLVSGDSTVVGEQASGSPERDIPVTYK